MKPSLSLLLLLILAATSCTSRSNTRLQSQAAYAAGQQQALMRIHDAQRTSIRVMGNVQNPEILWEEGLTLARVIAAAAWLDHQDPRQIVVVRQRERFPVDPSALLRGHDIPLEPGDTVEVHP